MNWIKLVSTPPRSQHRPSNSRKRVKRVIAKGFVKISATLSFVLAIIDMYRGQYRAFTVLSCVYTVFAF